MRALGISMALLLAVGVAACGSGTSAQPVPKDTIVLAAAKTAEAGTYKADVSGTVEAAGQSMKVSGTGEFDAKRQRGSMSMTMTGAGQNLDMQVVMAFPLMYVRFPPVMASGLPPGKSWVKMNLEKLGQQMGIDLAQLMQSAQSDPSEGLKYLQGVTDVQALGNEDVRGVSTTHYKGVVDLNALAAENAELKPTIDKLVQQLGMTRLPVEVWVDGNGLVRRMKQTFDGAGSSSTMTTDLYDFGATVDISPPPADEVVDMAKLIGQQS